MQSPLSFQSSRANEFFVVLLKKIKKKDDIGFSKLIWCLVKVHTNYVSISNAQTIPANCPGLLEKKCFLSFFMLSRYF